MAGLAAEVAVFVSLFAAPLALGSYVVVQRASRVWLWLWFGGLVGLLGLSLLAAALGLLLSFLT